MRKRALITGLSGFTGHYVAETLQADYDIFGIGTNTSNMPNCYNVDINNLDTLKSVLDKIQPDIVLHLAAVAFVAHGNVDDFYKVNLIGTRNLLQSIYETLPKIDAVLIASSANVYGNNMSGKLSELSEPNPANDYAVSKLAMEYMSKLWMDKLPIFIVRPFNYTGIGQSSQFLIPKIIHHFKEKSPEIELGNIDVWRDFSDVRTVAKYYQLLIAKKPIGKTINICSGKLYSLRDVIDMAQDLTGHRIEIKVNPLFVREHEVSKLYGDNTILKQIVGDVEVPDLKETLAWMLDVETSQ